MFALVAFALVTVNQAAYLSKKGSLMRREAKRRRSHGDELARSFVGASPIVSQKRCTEDTYTPSEFEQTWTKNLESWTADHCKHMSKENASNWISGNANGTFDSKMFSALCRKGKRAQFIEPLAGILRDPHVGCFDDKQKLASIDWLVFPTSEVSPHNKARFYDTGGSPFNQGLQRLLLTYEAHEVIFDEVFVWDHAKQGPDAYWKDVDPGMRRFWEPRLTFYAGVPVSTDPHSNDNPVNRIFNNCRHGDYCAMKLDINMPRVESSLLKQLSDMPTETKGQVDELFFGYTLDGNLDSNLMESYKILGELRKLGVRAHSWV